MKHTPLDSSPASEGMHPLLGLVLAVVATIVVLVIPGHRWGPEMWPFYVGTAGVLLWVAIDLWNKLRSPSAAIDNTQPNEPRPVQEIGSCPLCLGTGWVCEQHPARPWRHDSCGGAAVQCACNPEGSEIRLPAKAR